MTVYSNEGLTLATVIPFHILLSCYQI